LNKLETSEEFHISRQSPVQTTASGGYDPLFFEELARVEDRHFWFQARNHLISRLVKKISSRMSAGYSVLEVGCGTGNVLRVLQETCRNGRVVGLELWFDGLRFARKRTNARLVQGDVRNYPFGKQFDLIGMFDVLEHVPEELETLRALRDALAPDGKLILTVPAHQFLWSYFDEAAHHCRRYSLQELRARLVEAGFQVEFISQFMACTFPIVWLWRKVSGRRQHGKPDDARTLSAREFRVVPVMNGALTMLLRLEARWLSRGRGLPIGTSLLVIARKQGTV
jgi:SAM-dependent methyltransferase